MGQMTITSEQIGDTNFKNNLRYHVCGSLLVQQAIL